MGDVEVVEELHHGVGEAIHKSHASVIGDDVADYGEVAVST
jgi:thiamine monophosphate kinase